MTSIIRAVQEWINGCHYLTDFTGGQHIDWTDCAPGNYGLAPTGSPVVEVSEDVLGNRTVYKQYNLALYARNWTVDDVIRLENTTFLDDFQQWVEEQQAAGITPKFGDDPDTEEISAQNGMLFELAEDGQTGLYQIQIKINYLKRYERSGS